MRESRMILREQTLLAENVRCMRLEGEGLEQHRPGQFVNLQLEGHFLRRPISVFDQEGDTLCLIYKAVGKGTEQMARMESGEVLSVLTGLGNGYDLTRAGEAPLLIGGGVGVPPLYLLARRLREQGKKVTALLGFGRREELFGKEKFEALGCEVIVTTLDGSAGKKGRVTDVLPEAYSFFYACGPLPMLKAVCGATATNGQLSFEERMGCGFGACMGCSIQTRNGFKRICREGPVLDKEEILF